MPRFGIRLFLDDRCRNIQYFGKGPDEAYLDKQQASCYGEFRTSVDAMAEDYIRPQETGSHIGTRYVEAFSEEGYGLKVISLNKPVSFSSLPYSQEKLESARHNFALLPDEFITLCIDCFHCGVGSRSCGPKLAEKYRPDEREVDFAFIITRCPASDDGNAEK